MSTKPHITKAMIKAVKDTEKFYREETDLTRACLCHAALENKAFNSWWDYGCCDDHELDRFVKQLVKAVWK